MTKEISSLESVDKSCRDLHEKLVKLQKEVGKVDVWSKEQGPVAEDLKVLLVFGSNQIFDHDSKFYTCIYRNIDQCLMNIWQKSSNCCKRQAKSL